MTAVSIMIVTCVRSAVVMGGSITIIVTQHRHTHEINIASSSFLYVAIFKELRIQEPLRRKFPALHPKSGLPMARYEGFEKDESKEQSACVPLLLLGRVAGPARQVARRGTAVQKKLASREPRET